MKTMKKQRFDRLVKSLDEVRTHVATGRFAGRISKVDADGNGLRKVMNACPARSAARSEAE